MPVTFPAPRHVAGAFPLSIALSFCVATLLTAPPSAHAQLSAPAYRVATLGADPTLVWDVFQRRLKQLGYIEGGNLDLERRWSRGYEDRLPKLLTELLHTKPDVLVSSSMFPPTLGIDASRCVPILTIAVSEPYGSTCRAYPVARMTQSASAQEVSTTHLRLARSLVPSATRFAVLTDSDRPFLVDYVKGLEAAAAAAGVTVHVFDVSGDPDIGNLAAAITREAPDVLIVGPSFLRRPDGRRQIVSFATARGIPSIGSYVADGVVIAADYDWADLARRAADFVDQLLKGAKPADLSTSAPTRFEVIVDARVAKVLGLTIPESVLSQANRVLN